MILLAMANNVETQQAVNAEDFSNWEFAEDSATRCWRSVTQTVPLTLELREPDSSSWAVCLWKLGHFEFDMDFPRFHAMLRWLHEELWDCTKDFVLQHKLIEKANPLSYKAGSKEAYMLEITQWHKIDERELTDWTFLIGHTQVPNSAFLDGFTTEWGSVDSVTDLLRSADEIRHAAAHHRPTSVGDLFQAMLLPRVLKDTKRADRIEQTFYAISDEAGRFFDESTRMDAERIIYTLPCETTRQKLAKLESLLQTLCFSYAQRKAPNLLSSHCWVVPERVEISKLSDYRFQTLYQDDFPDERFDIESLHETVVALKHLRNQLWHRHPISDTDFLDFFHAAVRFAIYTGDRAGSINIEVETEMMFTGKSREDVLARLHRVYQAEELPADEDDRRRECRRRVAIGKVLEESGIELSSRETFTNWNYMVLYPRPEEPYWEEPCVESTGTPLTDLENDSPWGIDSPLGMEDPAAADLKEAYPDDKFWGEGHADSKYIDSDHQHSDEPYSDEPYSDEPYSDDQGSDETYSEQPYSEQPYSEQPYSDQPYPEYTDSENPETTIRETQAQPSDPHTLKEPQITVTTIDPPSSPPDSPPTQSQETIDSTPPSSTTSQTPTSPKDTSHSTSNPTTISQSNSTTLSITHDFLDISNGSATAAGMASDSKRLLTFSPSMHEFLRW